MTKAQWEVRSKQISDDAGYELRKFRKECVTLGIVEFVRDYNYYEMKYRGQFVCYLFCHDEDNTKLRSAWNAIQIAEETIEKIEGVKHESN